MKTTSNNTTNNITVNGTELLNKLNSIKTVKNRKYKPILKIQSGENSGLTFLNVGEYLNYIETDLKCETESENELYVNFYDLLDTVKDLNGISENIDISVDKDNDIEVTADYLSVKLDNLDEVEWKEPNRDIDYKNNKYFKFNTMDKKEFRKFIKDFEYLKKHSASKDVQIPVVAGVNFKVIDNTLKLESLDGFRLMFSEYPIIANNENFDFIISPETMDLFIKVLKNNIQNENVVGIERTKDGLVIGINDITIYGEVLDGKFFDTSGIYNPPENDQAINIIIDKNKLSKTLNLIKKSSEAENKLMVIEKQKDNNFVKIRNGEKNVSATFDHNDNNEFIIGFNSGFVLEAINNIDNDITITLTKDQMVAPCYIFDNNNCYEILPVRLNG